MNAQANSLEVITTGPEQPPDHTEVGLRLVRGESVEDLKKQTGLSIGELTEIGRRAEAGARMGVQLSTTDMSLVAHDAQTATAIADGVNRLITT